MVELSLYFVLLTCRIFFMFLCAFVGSFIILTCLKVVLRFVLDRFCSRNSIPPPPLSAQRSSVCFYRPCSIAPNHLEMKQGDDTLVGFRGEEMGSRGD